MHKYFLIHRTLFVGNISWQYLDWEGGKVCLASPALSPFVKTVTHPEWAQDSEQCRKVTEGHPDATPPVFFSF